MCRNSCSEQKIRDSAVGTFKNICTVAVHYWYIKHAFAEFWQQTFEKKEFFSEGILRKIDKKLLPCLAYFGQKICQAWRKSFVDDPLVVGGFHLNSKFISKSSSHLREVKISFKTRLWFVLVLVNRLVLFHVISS